MSFAVALQSVLYYVVACSACRKCAYRRKRKREATLAKQRKGELENDDPSLYRHPSPFSTNIYWRDELALGPGPPPKRSGKDHRANQRRLATGGTEISVVSASSHGERLSNGGVPSPPETLIPEDWQYRRHQREDEVLWGYPPQSSQGGSLSGSQGGLAPAKPYYMMRNPPLNDLHPPVVSTQPTDKSKIRWMLQPPPNARIMSGKEKASGERGESTENGKASDTGLGRQIGARIEERQQEPRKKAPDTTVVERGDTRAEDTRAMGQRHDRIAPATDTSKAPEKRKKRRPPPIWIVEDSSHSLRNSTSTETSLTAETPVRKGRQENIKPSSPRSSSNPPMLINTLSIIDAHATDIISTRNSKRAGTQLLQPTILPPESTSSLQVLQELVAPNSALNSRPSSLPLSYAPHMTATFPVRDAAAAAAATKKEATTKLLPPGALSFVLGGGGGGGGSGRENSLEAAVISGKKKNNNKKRKEQREDDDDDRLDGGGREGVVGIPLSTTRIRWSMDI